MTTTSEAGLEGCTRNLAPEHRVIVGMIPHGSRVLDLGCGDGALLRALAKCKGVRGEGIDVSPECIQECVAAGVLNVHQADLDEGLADHADKSVDYVILTSTLQVLHRPLALIQDMARVGRKCIIGLPNFAHWRARVQLGLHGRMPVTDQLPYQWYDTPNIHLTTIHDFRDLCGSVGLRVLHELDLGISGGKCRQVKLWPNLRASYAIFVVAGEE